MVEPLSLNFRVFTVKLVSVRKFRNFTVTAERSAVAEKMFENGQMTMMEERWRVIP